MVWLEQAAASPGQVMFVTPAELMAHIAAHPAPPIVAPEPVPVFMHDTAAALATGAWFERQCALDALYPKDHPARRGPWLSRDQKIRAQRLLSKRGLLHPPATPLGDPEEDTPWWDSIDIAGE